jgi:hypothetical protein
MKSIIFNQHQVNYALNNRKKMFRVVVKPYPWQVVINADFKKGNNIPKYGHDEREIKPKFEVGETIFVKEAYDIWDDKILFKADATKQLRYLECKWKSPVHMKQEHSRLTLKIKSVKVERLQDISCVQCFLETGLRPSVTHMDLDCDAPNPKDDFRTLWNSTHKKPQEKWEANPWVFVYECGE